MARLIGHNSAGNVALLRRKASRFAVYGALIGLSAVLVATAVVDYMYGGTLTAAGMVAAQRSNVALWLLDALPFAFALWGQYVGVAVAREADAMVRDHTRALRARTTAVERQALYDLTHDALTGLPNRGLLHDRLQQAIAAAGDDGHGLALLLMDLDEFKELNESLGQTRGDRLLQQVAGRLRATIPIRNTVARLGGDEFAVLLPRTGAPAEVSQIAQRLQRALEPPFVLDDMQVEIRASMGIAVFPEHGTDGDTLQQRAEAAMYAAKRDKRGTVMFDPKIDREGTFKLAVISELRQALEAGELVVCYQPKFALASGRMTDLEALVRWPHSQHKLLEPEDFIPLAERTGLIRFLTHWVLETTLRQFASWSVQHPDLGVAVNLSASDLRDLDLPEHIQGLLDTYRVPPERLMLEITETSILIDRERVLRVLTRLAKMGVRLSIDDFGTGYSSLSYLSILPVCEIKIDRSFVQDMTRNRRHTMIVKATIDLAHDLGLEVVAEGVEEAATLESLRQMGCDAVQGFLTGVPLGAEQVVALPTSLPAHLSPQARAIDAASHEKPGRTL